MKTLFRTVSVLLLAGAALLSGCKNPVDVEKAQIITSDAQAQVNALVAANDLLAGDSNYVSSLSSIVNALDGLTQADIPSIMDKLASMTAADPAFLKELSGLLAKYKLASTAEARASVGIDILAAAAGEVARAKARKEACDAAAVAKSDLESSISTLKGELSALPAEASSYDAYKALTSRTNNVLADVADLIKPYYPSSDALVTAFNGVASKLGDSFLKSAVIEYAKGAATEQSVIDLQNYLEAKIAMLKELGVEELDSKIIALQGKLDALLDPETGVGKRIDDLKGTVDGIIAEMSFVGEDGLQAYIDGAANKAYEDACGYVDEYMDYLIGQLNDIFDEVYDNLESAYQRSIMALQRIQSIVFVPEYEDLKMTVNYSAITQPVVAADGFQSAYTAMADLPCTVTYQVLPSQYAKDVAEQILDFEFYKMLIMYLYPERDLSGLTDKEIAKSFGLDSILASFDVIPLQTRGGDTPDIQYGMEILDVVSCDINTGYITFKVLPYNIASASFAAAGLKPRYDIGLTDTDGYYIQGWDPYDWNSATGIFRAEDPVDNSKTFTIPVWSLEDLQAYQARTAFGVQLQLYHFQDYDADEEIDWDNVDMDRYYSDPTYEPPTVTVYTDYENELASSFTTLYPNNAGGEHNFEIIAQPYKYKLDAEGYPIIDSGIAALEPIPAELDLPYNMFPGDADDPDGGYRTFLDGALPVVFVDGQYMSADNAVELYGIDFGLQMPYEAEIDFDGLKESLFIVDTDTYATIAMNPEASTADRAVAIGHTITARYYVNGPLGAYYLEGKVNIVGPK